MLVLSEPVRLGNHWIATASVSFSERTLEKAFKERSTQLLKRLAQITAAALISALFLCLALAISWTRPIGQFAQVAERIGNGNYDGNLAPTDRRSDELGALARAFRRMAIQLRELDQMKEDFVSAVTHELRSPLGAIESYLNLMGHELGQDIDVSDWRVYLERLRLNTQRLTRFVNDLLDVSAIERGKIRLEPQRTALGPLVHEILALFHPRLQEKALTAEVRITPHLPEAFVDPDKVRQIVTNLVANAIKFTPESGRLDIALESEPGQKMLRVAVKDTGIGISAEDQTKIFSRFEQIRSARLNVKGPKGTGIGLSICKTLVELHGGQLQVTSQPGQGSTFYFTVPIANAQGGSS
jgi:signal transduction histidine kinase